MTELLFDDVTVRFGRGRHAMNAVDQVTLAVPAGKVVGLVGESGSGKSTLARVAVGLTPVTSGRVLLDGAEPSTRRRWGTPPPVQMIFQDPFSSLDPRMSVGASIYEAMPRRTGRGRTARRAEVARLAELVHLDPDRMNMLPGRLSGGQRQRIALARALAAEPSVIVADEITSSLDVSVQGAMLNLVREVQRELDLGMLFISHNLAVVRYISDYIAVMYLGRIVEAGPANDILTDPRHPYTRELLAAAPHREAPKRAPANGALAVRDLAIAEPPDPHQPPSGCRFHTRCPIGPLVFPDREICVEEDPQMGAAARPHQAACHLAEVHSIGKTEEPVSD